jgi:murein DD-endopeptidase MepM/ murein hydrolase activator NlpD
MNLRKILNQKSFHIMLIPDQGGTEAQSKKFTSKQFGLTIILYTLLSAIIGFFVFRITPLDDLFFPAKSSLSNEEVEKIEQLNQRLYFLTKELEGLKSTNERLRYAIMLGDSTLIKDQKRNNDSTGKKKSKGTEGNIYAVFKKFFQNEEQKTDESFFFVKPVNGFISREFFPERGHLGIDLVVKTGTPVYSAATGYVVFSDYTFTDGYKIIINHSNDYISIYKHCSSLLKNERDFVLQGELIALSGNSGEISSGPHLHFEVWKNGKPVDPKNVIINY